MTISIPSDMVVNVARTAGPSMPEAATIRPNRASAQQETGAFASAVAGAGKSGGPHKTPEAFVKFEAMVLQTFMQSILPKEMEAVYGGGLAGEMWKSLLAEKLGEAMAERGGIGIADRVLGDYYLEGDQKVPIVGVSQGPEKADADEQARLSTGLIHELQRSFIKVIGEDHSEAAARADAGGSENRNGF